MDSFTHTLSFPSTFALDSDAVSARSSFVGLASFDGEKTDTLVDEHTATSQSTLCVVA